MSNHLKNYRTLRWIQTHVHHQICERILRGHAHSFFYSNVLKKDEVLHLLRSVFFYTFAYTMSKRTMSDTSSLRSYKSVKASKEADHLFSTEWKPGFLVESELILAVKCKKVIIADKVPNSIARVQNYLTPTHLYAFKDRYDETRAAFNKSAQTHTPSRVAVWSEQDGCYYDRGWGLAVEATENFYIFDISEGLQEASKQLAYPVRMSGVEDTERSSVHTEYNGHMYDSITEARHAVFFDTLGIAHVPHPMSFATPWGHWSIDFKISLHNPDDDSYDNFYVEIKPTEPLLEEEQRCISAAYQSEVPIIILFGEVGAPWVRESQRTSVSYDRKKPGIRGYLYTFANGVIVRINVVWAEPNPGFFTLKTVHSPYIDLSWETPRLVSAYEIAFSHSFS